MSFPNADAYPQKMILFRRTESLATPTRKAVAWLRDRGWVYTVPQRGTFVSPRKDWQSVDGGNA